MKTLEKLFWIALVPTGAVLWAYYAIRVECRHALLEKRRNENASQYAEYD